MPERKKVEYGQIELGYEFSPVNYELGSSMVSAYLKAVEETSSLYRGTEVIPPMAIAAYAMKALSEGIAIPPGAVHVSQELEFMGTVTVGDTISCHATVSRKQDRGRMRLLAVDLNVFNQDQKQVLAGRTSFVLPQPDRGEGL